LFIIVIHKQEIAVGFGSIVVATVLETAHQAFDQNTIDATWERLQEQALQAFQHGNPAKAQLCWARALDIAERHFGQGDPRLAASRSNQAFSLRRQQQIHGANTLFEQAQLAWEDSWRWIPLMMPAGQAGREDAAQYDEMAQRKFYDIIKRGQSITETLRWDERLPTGSQEAWLAIKPAAMTDVRKLMAAVWLMVSNRP
jgi:hypothetical protein